MLHLCYIYGLIVQIDLLSLILPKVVSFFYKNEGKRRFVIAFKIDWLVLLFTSATNTT